MKEYNVRVAVGFSELITIEANNREEAESIVEEMYYNGEIMDELKENEYFDGLIGIDVEEEI